MGARLHAGIGSHLTGRRQQRAGFLTGFVHINEAVFWRAYIDFATPSVLCGVMKNQADWYFSNGREEADIV